MPDRIINRRRPLGDGDLTTRYRRRHERADALDRAEDVAHVDEHWFHDDFDHASPADFTLHRLAWGTLATFAPVGGALTDDARLADHLAPAPTPADQLSDALQAHLTALAADGVVPRAIHDAMATLRALRTREPAFDRWFAARPDCALLLGLLAPFWVRSPTAWTAPVGDPDVDTIARSFVAHLLVRYAVPEPLFEPWRWARPNLKWVVWLVLLGQGASLQRAGRRWGWTVHPGFVHQLAQAPPSLDIVDAVMWAEVTRLGGAPQDHEHVRSHPAFTLDPTEDAPLVLPGFEEDDPVYERPRASVERRRFWTATTEWMIRHRAELDLPRVGAILDWAIHRHTEDLARAVPPHERFAWRGRTPAAATREALAYREQIRAPSRHYWLPISWRGRGWDWQERTDAGLWTVRELTSSIELEDEGRGLHHCVAGYGYACAQGRSAIFSLALDGVRRVTIELEPRSMRTIQARGFRNRECDAVEAAVVWRWLAAAKPRS